MITQNNHLSLLGSHFHEGLEYNFQPSLYVLETISMAEAHEHAQQNL